MYAAQRVLASLVSVGAFGLCAGPAAAETLTFTTAGETSFTVPAGVTSVQLTATGEAGANAGDPTGPSGAYGGLPAIANGTVSVTPGQRVWIEVGGGDTNGGPGGGGDASDVRGAPRASSLSAGDSRVIVGAGGGSAGSSPSSSYAGGNAGADGASGIAGCGGKKGTASAGGAGGTGAGPTPPPPIENGSPGTLGSGGPGGARLAAGGGGLFGGGSSGGAPVAPGGFSYACGGGGGGSSKVPAGGFTVLADRGTPPSVTLTYTAAQGGGGTGANPVAPPDKTKPAMTGMSFSPSAFQAAGSGAAIEAAVGSTVSYRLSEAATTTFTVERAATGRKKGKRCAKPTRKNRKAKRCTRYVKVTGKFTHTGKAGANRFTFRGRIGGRKLKVGRYRLTGVARDKAGNKSQAIRAGFRIKK